MNLTAPPLALFGAALIVCNSMHAAETLFFGARHLDGSSPPQVDFVSIDSSSGATEVLFSSPFLTGLDFTPDRSTLYGASNVLYTIDIAAETITTIGSLKLGTNAPLQMVTMTIAPDGQMYALSNPNAEADTRTRLYRVDKTSGALELLGVPDVPISAIEFAPDGTLYGTRSDATNDFVTLNPSDGSVLLTVGSLGPGHYINELDFSENGNLYGTHFSAGLYHINPATGAATPLTGYSGADQVWSLITHATVPLRIFGFPPTIEWRSAADKDYRVWASAELQTWVPASGVMPGSLRGVSRWTDDGVHDLGPPSPDGSRFYRCELVEVEPTLRFYGATGYGDGPNNFDLVDINPATGATTLAVAGTYWTGLDFSPDGLTLYAARDSLYTIDIAADSYTEIGPLTFAGGEPISMRGITVAPDGQIYALASEGDGNQLYRVDKTSGDLELVGTPEGIIWGIEFAPDGTLYAAAFDLLVLDPATGAVLRTVGDLGSAFVTELDFAADGNLYGTEYDDGIYQIDTTTGSATLLCPYTSGDEVWAITTQQH